MFRFFFIVVFVTANLCCNSREVATGPQPIATPIYKASPETKDESVESFSNERTIARAGKNKIELEIIEHPRNDTAYKPNKTAIIKFYSLSGSKEWGLKQVLEIESHALMEAEPNIGDFNNDGFSDFTFISNTAARGANEVRTLLIYDNKKDELIHIKNSENFPNLAYNKPLKCIDAWMFHGATTTVFLLKGDTLEEFASVDTGNELVVNVIDKNGERRVIRREKMNLDDMYTRYETFDPPIPILSSQ